ncbi:hypothetical protein [Candidatus Binatus sp.]|uniref:hypothetical protein n=1 Tax=Candidatus Binatus sp. TaxID=2811406 RepID=UPI003C713268
MRRSRPLAIVRATLALAGAIACAACSSGSPAVVSVQKKVQGLLGQPNVTSFLDVRFGDSLYRVQNRFPDGSLETAPYGADTYRLENIEVDGVRYQRVKYEFTSYSGMQLVMAWFTPDSSEQVLEKLIAAIGAPTEQDSAKGSAPADTRAMWRLPHGERVVFDGPKRFVAVLGPGGGPLRQDEAENEALDSP